MKPIEGALEAAILALQNGSSTVAAERILANILKGYRQEGVTTVWRLDFVSAITTVGDESKIVVRPVGPIGVNLYRAAAVADLGERVARGEVDIAALEAEIARVRHVPSLHGRWLLVAAAAFTAGCFSQIPGGDWGSLGIAAIAAGVGQSLRSVLQAKEVAIAQTTFLCGLVSALIAALGLRQGYSAVPTATFLAAVIYIVPGLPLINGFGDVVSHKYLLVGIERIMNATFLFLLLAVAIALAHTSLL